MLFLFKSTNPEGIFVQFSIRMFYVDKKDPGLSSAAQSTVTNVVSCSSWGHSSDTHARQSPASGGLGLNMGALNPYFHYKNLGIQLQDQDSTSTQSTGQSYGTVANIPDGLHGHNVISAPPGYDQTHEKIGLAQSKLASSTVTQDTVFPVHVDGGQPVARIPLPYGEPYFSGMVAVNHGSQPMIHHPHTMGMFPARVPLPLDLQEDEPIFVNAKQYRAILRRREYRARLEAQNKLIKNRKPYLHESRHLHALKRARGAGGRFVNTKKLEESNPGTMSNSLHHPENYRNAASTTPCSNVSIAGHTDDIFHQHQDFRFSGYPSHAGITMQGLSGDMRGGQNLHNHSGLLVSLNRQS